LERGGDEAFYSWKLLLKKKSLKARARRELVRKRKKGRGKTEGIVSWEITRWINQ